MGFLVRLPNVKSVKSAGYLIMAIEKLTERTHEDSMALQVGCETFRRMFPMNNELDETVFGGNYGSVRKVDEKLKENRRCMHVFLSNFSISFP